MRALIPEALEQLQAEHLPAALVEHQRPLPPPCPVATAEWDPLWECFVRMQDPVRSQAFCAKTEAAQAPTVARSAFNCRNLIVPDSSVRSRNDRADSSFTKLCQSWTDGLIFAIREGLTPLVPHLPLSVESTTNNRPPISAERETRPYGSEGGAGFYSPLLPLSHFLKSPGPRHSHTSGSGFLLGGSGPGCLWLILAGE